MSVVEGLYLLTNIIHSQIKSRSYSKVKIKTTKINFLGLVGLLLVCPVQKQFYELLSVLGLNSFSFKL